MRRKVASVEVMSRGGGRVFSETSPEQLLIERVSLGLRGLPEVINL